MLQTKIVLVDLDVGYLQMLERAFLLEYRHTAEIVLISTEAYMEEYFAEPQGINILVIHEKQYSASLDRHRINHLFVLTDEGARPTKEIPAGKRVRKSADGAALIDYITRGTRLAHATNLKAPAQVVLVAAPAGGMGKTTLAAGLCTLLAQHLRRVLFLGIDSLQTYGCLLEADQRLPQDTADLLRQKSPQALGALKPLPTAEGTFDILPPFCAAPDALGITQEDFRFLIDQLRQAGEYDYIFVESGAGFTRDTRALMDLADQVLLVTRQDKNSVYKLKRLLENVDCTGPARYTLVCNHFRNGAENFLEKTVQPGWPAVEYVGYSSKAAPAAGLHMASLRDIKKLGRLFIDDYVGIAAPHKTGSTVQ